MLSQIPAFVISFLPTLIMLALFVMIFKMQGLGEKGKYMMLKLAKKK